MIEVEGDHVGKVQDAWETPPYGLTSSWDKDGAGAANPWTTCLAAPRKTRF
jgi:hypothetical protein